MEFKLGGRRAEVKRMPWLWLGRAGADNRRQARTEACQHTQSMEAYENNINIHMTGMGGKPATYCELHKANEIYVLQQCQDDPVSCVGFIT